MRQQDSTTTSSLPPNSFVWFWCGFLKIGLTPYPFDFRISHEISHPAIVFQFDLETSVETDRWRLLPRRSWFSRTVHFPSHTRRRREVPAEDTLIAMENDEKMMRKWWSTNGNQRNPMESNGIQCDLGWFEELPLFSETSMMDHLNGERWSIGQVPVESQKMSDTVMHFLNWRCFRRSRFQIFFATPNSYYHHGYHHFLHTFPHIFGSPEKKQKRLLRVAPTARYSVVDLEVYCTCCTPDVSLFFVFFILFPFISYVPCAAESIVHLDESPVELKNIQGYFAAEHSLSLGVWTSQLAWWTNRMEMWVKTARFWGLSKCHVQTRWITYLIYVKSSQKRPSSGVTCRPTRAKNLRLGHRKADFLL